MNEHSNILGVIIGGIVGVIKSIFALKTSLLVILATLNWSVAFDTAILALIGGSLGWCGSELMKLIKKLYKKYTK